MISNFDLSQYIEDIELNGLKGRVVNAPASDDSAKNVNILFVHGHHSCHERLTGAVELLQKYGNVCLPDLPGFGGMSSMFSIGEKPTIDSLADYLAAFVKMQYGNRKKFIIVGYSMGFMVVTRMLQKYPAMHKQITDVVAVAGLVHRDDIRFSYMRRLFYISSAMFLGMKLPAFITKTFFLRKWFLGTIYTRLHNAKEKFSGAEKNEFNKMVDFEVNLWRINDIPTWCFTSIEMLTVDLVTDSRQMPLGLISVTIDADRYFDNQMVEQHLNVIYSKVKTVQANVSKHGGSMIETAEQAEEFIPNSVRKHLKSLR